jgi:hypothetical protein
VVEIAEGLEIDVERLRANLELTGGQIMAEAVSFALAEKSGARRSPRAGARAQPEAAQEKRAFKEVLLTDLRIKAQLSGLEIEKLFIPLTYQGSAQTFIDRWWSRARCGHRAGPIAGQRSNRSPRRRPGRPRCHCRSRRNCRRSPTHRKRPTPMHAAHALRGARDGAAARGHRRRPDGRADPDRCRNRPADKDKFKFS